MVLSAEITRTELLGLMVLLSSGPGSGPGVALVLAAQTIYMVLLPAIGHVLWTDITLGMQRGVIIRGLLLRHSPLMVQDIFRADVELNQAIGVR